MNLDELIRTTIDDNTRVAPPQFDPTDLVRRGRRRRYARAGAAALTGVLVITGGALGLSAMFVGESAPQPIAPPDTTHGAQLYYTLDGNVHMRGRTVQAEHLNLESNVYARDGVAYMAEGGRPYLLTWAGEEVPLGPPQSELDGTQYGSTVAADPEYPLVAWVEVGEQAEVVMYDTSAGDTTARRRIPCATRQDCNVYVASKGTVYVGTADGVFGWKPAAAPGERWFRPRRPGEFRVDDTLAEVVGDDRNVADPDATQQARPAGGDDLEHRGDGLGEILWRRYDDDGSVLVVEAGSAGNRVLDCEPVAEHCTPLTEWQTEELRLVGVDAW